ncbi:MAG TPA: hypothetical protein VMF03_16515 [Steroidobacteraceae bacterium]|nr:hypothetical protein [Steroidobacteraceae bacterium]
MKHANRLSLLLGLLPGLAMLPAAAQAPSEQARATEADHRQMMQQLGITQLRPGPNADADAPNHANYDEARANPYPDYPDPLRMNNGTKVTTAAQWYRQRRPQIIEDFEREVLGRIPANTPAVSFTVKASENERVGAVPVSATLLTGHLDNSADPAISVDFPVMLIKPLVHSGPMPLLIMFSIGTNFPSPVPPSAADVARMNAALRAAMVKENPALADVLEKHPAWQPIPTPPFFPAPRPKDDPVTQLVADGWAVAQLDPTAVQADNGAGLLSGVIGLTNKGQPRKPDDWGALRAWAWGASRVLDYVSHDPDINAAQVGIEGVSRYGKAALITMAFDTRFAMVLVGSSGEGGAKPHRRNFGEAVESLTGAGEYHWMAGNFLKYGASEARGGAKTAGDLPVDSSELIALCAPRLTFISYGSPSAGDALWLDQQGSYMATVAAGKVFRLLGAKDLGVGDDYQHAKKPDIGVGLLEGQLAWRQHEGGHTDVPNFRYFIAWADRFLGRPADAHH